MDTVTMKIAAINEAEYNPRKDLQPGDPEYKVIKNSIRRFTLVEPLIVNKRNNTLVGGHQRLKVLREMEVTEVEVSLVDLDESDERILNILLNRVKGFWDYDKLLPLLKEIREAGELSTTGFSDIEFDSMNYDHSHIQDLIDESFSDTGTRECDEFAITFTLPEAAHVEINAYLVNEEDAKEKLATAVLNHIRGYDE
ncbi:MAG: ParB N-terminal domain-containing protein [Oscillospiraceae bacterium]|nr:ParB N-terminal domain-containing protein [Oscillospiraceae bacterium]